MFQQLTIPVLIGLTAAAAACGTSQKQAVRDNPANQGTAMNSDQGKPATATEQAVSQRFGSLDEYLAWLKKTQAPVDGSWYEEIRPGVYQLQTGNLRVLGPSGDETPPGEILTRAQLMEKFGFTR